MIHTSDDSCTTVGSSCNRSRWDQLMNSSHSTVVSSPHLFARRTEDLRIFDRVTYFLQECGLSSVCSSYDEYAKMATLSAEIDSFVHDWQ